MLSPSKLASPGQCPGASHLLKTHILHRGPCFQHSNEPHPLSLGDDLAPFTTLCSLSVYSWVYSECCSVVEDASASDIGETVIPGIQVSPLQHAGTARDRPCLNAPSLYVLSTCTEHSLLHRSKAMISILVSEGAPSRGCNSTDFNPATLLWGVLGAAVWVITTGPTTYAQGHRKGPCSTVHLF